MITLHMGGVCAAPPDVLTAAIVGKLSEKNAVVIAIDGRCAAGKSTLAAALCTLYGADARLLHMDDYFLPDELRTAARLNEPGGNVHYERFRDEVVAHIAENITFRRYDCSTKTLLSPVTLPYRRITVVEGAYSLHPYFGCYYDVAAFCDVDAETQQKRILRRDPALAERFFSEWIPLEEAYFRTVLPGK